MQISIVMAILLCRAELIEASEDADLLIVGSRDAGGFTRLMKGLSQQPGIPLRALPLSSSSPATAGRAVPVSPRTVAVGVSVTRSRQ